MVLLLRVKCSHEKRHLSSAPFCRPKYDSIHKLYTIHASALTPCRALSAFLHKQRSRYLMLSSFLGRRKNFSFFVTNSLKHHLPNRFRVCYLRHESIPNSPQSCVELNAKLKLINQSSVKSVKRGNG